jgi:chromosome partitioning protein
MKIPFTAVLRDTQNYIRAAEKGLGIFEMAPSAVWQDLEQWEELTDWLKSRSSLPKAA